jgi:hypothetical protein
MPGIAVVLTFAGLLCILILLGALLYNRHARTCARRDMKRHVQRIGREERHGPAFDPATRP